MRLYLKRATPAEALAEYLCYGLGTALGLPIPPAYLVADPGGFAGGGWLVGSLDAGMPSLRHFVDIADPLIAQALAGWRQLPDAALFDEWTANDDRNQGNLLWDADQQWALIDHARALGASPPGRPVPDAQVAVTNQLARLIAGLLGEVGIMRLRKRAAPFGDSCRAMDHRQLLAALPMQALGLAERAETTLSFLATRILHLPALLARHGHQPELPL